MERLTEHHANKAMGAYMACSEQCNYLICDSDCEEIAKIVARLAAYEDTGLEPEEITTSPYGCVFYCNRKCNLDDDFCAEGPGCPYEINAETAKHLLELVQAEKDGRLAVLPCKVGDIVFDIQDGTPYATRVLSFSYFNDGHWACRTVSSFPDLNMFGERVFLTREEAEAALKKREVAGNEAD